MNLLIGISGCDGGTQGPQGIYQELQKSYENEIYKFLPFDTIPDDIDNNIEKVSEIAHSNLGSSKNIYLMGHSMGGAIAALAADRLNESVKNSIKGLILIDTQTDGLNVLEDLSIPILFYHGKEDRVFPAWQIESVYKRYSGPKKMVEIENLDHDLAPVRDTSKSKEFSQSLAKDLFSEISGFFFNENSNILEENREIIIRTISLTPKKSLWNFINCFFRQKSE